VIISTASTAASFAVSQAPEKSPSNNAAISSIVIPLARSPMI
jgi:hypothetical protein